MTWNTGIKGLSQFVFMVQNQDFYDLESALSTYESSLLQLIIIYAEIKAR